MTKDFKRARGVYCSPEQRDAIRERAAAADKTVSRLVLDAALADRTGDRASALSAEELTELLRGFQTLVAFVRLLRGRAETSGDPGTAVSEDGKSAAGNGRPAVGAVRLSISATDREWTAIGKHARQRGLPVSRYLVGLVLPVPDGSVSGPHADPLPALDGVEQRELLDAVRLMRSLLFETGGPGAAPDGMRERLAALLDAAECTGGTGEAGCSPTAGRGDHRAETAVAPQVPHTSTEAEGAEQAASTGTGTEPEAKPSRQGDLLNPTPMERFR